MPLDFSSLALDPIYALKGVPAQFISAEGKRADLTVCDVTAGMAVADKTLVETVKPAATVRATELAAAGLTRADLGKGRITFNGATWRIESAHVLAGPNGVGSGEYQLVLAP